MLATTFSSAPFITSWPWCFFESFTSGPVTRRPCPCLLINALQKGLQIPPLHEGPFSCGRIRSVSSSSHGKFMTLGSWLRMGILCIRDILLLRSQLRMPASTTVQQGTCTRGVMASQAHVETDSNSHCTRNMWPIRAAGDWVVVRQRGSGAQFCAWLRNDNFHRHGAAYTLKSYYT